MQPAEYLEFLVDRFEVIEKAWQSRQPGLAGWGLGHAVVAQNRRAVYADGHAQMYGKTNRPDFRGFEGYEDHGVEVLFFWDLNQNSSPPRSTWPVPPKRWKHNLAVSADYWDEVRKLLRARHGEGLVVLGWIGAAGDQSPHLMYRKAAEERMRQLRGLTRVAEIARRIDQRWEDAYQVACKEKHAEIVLAHAVPTIQLPPRMVTAKEYATAKAQVEKLFQVAGSQGWMRWHQSVLDRFEQQQAGHIEPYAMELHVGPAGRRGDCDQ